jgi:hypothetical protein
MKAYLASLILTTTLCGCYGMAHYQTAPDVALSYGTGAEPVIPKKFEVESEHFPIFKVLSALNPPPKISSLKNDMHAQMVNHMQAISSSDKWQVTHVIGHRYIIQSKDYNERQCRYLNQLGIGSGGFVNTIGICLRDYDYGIYITQDGKVDGGWELLPSDRIMAVNRYMYMSWEPSKNQGWPVDIVFKPQK